MRCRAPRIDRLRRWPLGPLGRVLIAAVLLGLRGTAAPPENPDSFFGATRVWTFHLRFTAEGWDHLEPPLPTRPQPGGHPPEREYPWSTAELETDGIRMPSVAVRFKGNSSFNLARRSGKYPFKLDFNRGHPGRTLAGLKALWLNNNANDPDQMGEVLAYEIFRQSGLAAPRTAFVRLRVSVEGRFDDRTLGLYTAVESVDGDFLERSFGGNKGLLAKPERLAGIEYLGPDWDRYPDRYHVRDGAASESRDALMELARWIEQASPAEFRSGLARRVDLPGLYRFLAINALLANHDSFLGTGHNFHLFLDAADPRARFIPWDLNEAFGRHPPVGQPAQQIRLSVLRPGGHPNRLLDRILSDPELAGAYRMEVERLLPTVLDADRIRARAREVAAATGGSGRIDTGAAGPDAPTLGDWVERRARFVADELAGRDPGIVPQRGADRRRGPRPPGGPGPGPDSRRTREPFPR